MKRAKALSAIIAAIMISGTAVSVSAADYGSDPGYTPPPVSSPVGRPVDPGAAAAGVSQSSPNMPAVKYSEVTSRAITVALETGAAVPIKSGKAAVKSSSLAQLAKKEEAVLRFEANRFTAEIEASSVIDPKNIDIGLNITKNSSRGALIIKTRQRGEYGCTVKYSIPAKIYEQAGVDLSKAAVYVVDRRTGVAVLYSQLDIDEDGNIVFEVFEGGDFIIL